MEKTKVVSQGYRVDMTELLSRVDSDRELLRDLVMLFKEDFPRHMEVLRKAVAAPDLKAAKIVSHTLKGMLSNLAVTRASALAGNLEQLAAGSGSDALPEALVEFEREVDGLLPEMEALVEEVKP